VEFYKRVRPFGPGWRQVRKEAGIPEGEVRASGENFPMSLLGWFSGSIVVWSALFTVGNFLYGRTDYALALLAVFVVSGAALLYVINKLWSPGKTSPAA
jgi:solute:Na+ symporter, SSS family